MCVRRTKQRTKICLTLPLLPANSGQLPLTPTRCIPTDRLRILRTVPVMRRCRLVLCRIFHHCNKLISQSQINCGLRPLTTSRWNFHQPRRSSWSRSSFISLPCTLIPLVQLQIFATGCNCFGTLSEPGRSLT